ncbi:MAG: YbhN family protein [Candidatus Omnitrophota bacterium]
MTKYFKNHLLFILRLGLSAGLLWFLFSRIDTAELLELLKGADPGLIALAFVLFALIHGALLFRWRLYINALHLDISWLNMSRYFFLGLFGNLFLPSAIGGDVIKAAGLCLRSEEKPKIVASILLDRLSGFAGMVVLATLAFVVGFRLIENPLVILLVAGMAGALVFLGTVLFNEKIYTWFCRVFSFFPKLKSAVMQMHYDIVLLKGRKDAIVKSVALSCFAQVLLALTFYWLALALQAEVTFFYFLIFTPITCVASSFPSIGGLGFREAGLEYLLIGAGVTAGIGISVGLLDFVFMIIVGVAGWVFFMLTGERPAAEEQRIMETME